MRRRFETLLASVALGTLTALSGASFAHAQVDSVSATGPQIYTPADFTQFQPVSAADMVFRIPGFTLQGNEGDGRGFGQASLNILINGRRPSSKSSDARDILSRIPANTVTRIEIIDGASLDIPGLSGQVANIIAKAGSVSGTWRYAARFEEGTEPQLLEGEINLSGQNGNLGYVLGLDFGQFTFTDDGPEQFFNGDGVLIEDRFEDGFFKQEHPQANLNLTLDRYNGDVAHFNLSGGLRNRNSGVNESFDAITEAGRTGESRGSGGQDRYNYEISGDYASNLDLFGADGRLKFIGLFGVQNTEFNNVFVFNEFGNPIETSRFTGEDTEKEYIGRAEYTWKQGEKQDWAFGLEGAINTLDSTSTFSDDSGTGLPEIVRVEEKRLDTNLTNSWALSDKINMQTSIAAEYSQIDVVTNDTPSESFFRPKGFISASYNASDTYTWRARVERSVGQLDFDTFVSSVNLNDNFTTAGNRTVPDQRWTGELELERQDDKAISGTFKVYLDLVDDPIDRVLIEQTDDDGNDILVEAPGNLSSATIYGASANITWVLDSIGLEGMRLEAEAEVNDSRIEDPLTLENRTVNNTTLWEYDIELRHDIPNTPYAWEFEIEQSRGSRFFRLDNVFETRFLRPEARLTFVHKTFLGMQWSVSASNLFNFRSNRERTIFSPNRLGDIVQTETFDRQRGRRLSISVNDTF